MNVQNRNNFLVNNNTVGSLSILSYNVLTLSTEAKLLVLEEELKEVDWDVVGLAEVRRKGEDCLILKSGNILYFIGEQEGLGGTGILVKKKWGNNIEFFSKKTDRIVFVILSIGNVRIRIIQVYAPTSSCSEPEIEEFYEKLQEVLEENNAGGIKTFVIGDLNAKLGRRKQDENQLGEYGYGERNRRGQRLLEFASQNGFYVINSFFQAKDKWTWISPNGKIKNEIDFILTREKKLVQNFEVLDQPNVGSDHRAIRVKICIRKREMRKQKFEKLERINGEELKNRKYEYSAKLKENLQCKLPQVGQNLEKENSDLNQILIETASKFKKKNKGWRRKLSRKTLKMLEKRRKMKNRGGFYSKVEYAELNKLIKRQAEIDINSYNMECLQQAIEKNSSLRKVRGELAIGKREILSVRENNGDIITNKEKIIKRISEFYRELYSCEKILAKRESSKGIEPVTEKEIELVLAKMKNGKAGGKDKIVGEMLKYGGKAVVQVLCALYNYCLKLKTIPKEWKTSKVCLLFKKGDTKDLNNYRPISLLSVAYKILSKIIVRRISDVLENNQPPEQAGFRSSYSTLDHILVVKEVIRKSEEFTIPVIMCFVDYFKAFDSVFIHSVLEALEEQGIEEEYIEWIHNTYVGSIMEVEGGEVEVKKGVRQGDPGSPKYFSAVLEKVFRALNWQEKGLDVNGKRLSHLRFADDIVIFSNTYEELHTMIEELEREGRKVGLEMNINKTKVMRVNMSEKEILRVGDREIEEVEEFVYLGSLISKNDEWDEINRRVNLAWGSFSKYRHFLRNKNIKIKLKIKIMKSCVLPTLLYGCETWVFKKQYINKLRCVIRRMERAILGVTLRDRKRNSWVRERTRMIDVGTRMWGLKCNWIGHVLRRNDERWTKEILKWKPREYKRRRGRPRKRWDAEFKYLGGEDWWREAENRENWKKLREKGVSNYLSR